jgi:hypothetical protein
LIRGNKQHTNSSRCSGFSVQGFRVQGFSVQELNARRRQEAGTKEFIASPIWNKEFVCIKKGVGLWSFLSLYPDFYIFLNPEP